MPLPTRQPTRQIVVALLAAGACLLSAGRPAAALLAAADPHPQRGGAGLVVTSPAPGALTGAALAQQQQLTLAAQQWQQQLANLAAEARRQGDNGLLIVVNQVDGMLQSISLFPATLAGFLAALQASQNAVALWRNQQPSAGAAGLPEWQEADRGATDLSTAEETGFVFAADLTSGAAWSYAEGDAGGAPPPDAAADGAEMPGTAAGGARTEGEPGPSGEVDGDGGEEEPSSAGAGLMAEPAAGASGGAFAGLAGDPQADEDLAALAEVAVPGAAEGPAPGWIVIHGGPAPGGTGDMAADEMAANGDPAFVLQLGALDDGAAALDDGAGLPADRDGDAATAGAEDTDAGSAAAEALPGGGQVCSPWQPSLVPASCLLRPPFLASLLAAPG
jgi:hypothetical protein